MCEKAPLEPRRGVEAERGRDRVSRQLRAVQIRRWPVGERQDEARAEQHATQRHAHAEVDGDELREAGAVLGASAVRTDERSIEHGRGQLGEDGDLFGHAGAEQRLEPDLDAQPGP
jgi:hypothetical protein